MTVRPQLTVDQIKQKLNCEIIQLQEPALVKIAGTEKPHLVRTLTIDGFLKGEESTKRTFRPRESYNDQELFDMWLDSLSRVFSHDKLFIFGLPTLYTYELPIIHPMTYESALVETAIEDLDKKVFSLREVDLVEVCDVIGRIWFEEIEQCS